MTPEIYELFRSQAPLPEGTRINTTGGGVPTGETHKLPRHVLESANRCPNHLSDSIPFWILGWTDLHDDLFILHGSRLEQLTEEPK